MNYLLNKNRIYLIFLTKIFIGSLSSQTQDDLKQFLDTYDKIKTDQEVNEMMRLRGVCYSVRRRTFAWKARVLPLHNARSVIS